MGITISPGAIDQRAEIGELSPRIGKFVAQRTVAPITLGAIAGGELGRKWHDARQHQVELENPPSTTTISPVTKRLPSMSESIVSATSSAVTTRFNGVSLARRPIRSSYLSLSMRFIQSPSIQPGATALTRISGPRLNASVLVRLTTAALLAA